MPSNSTELLTIIIPAYNEEQRIGETLQKYLDYYELRYSKNYKILVVLNGCKDNTEGVVKKFKEKYPSLDYLVFDDPIGKGGAIKEGLKVANTELVAFTDADSSTRPEILHRLIAVLELTDSLDCVIGSRNMVGSVVTGKSQKRKIMSSGFNFGVNFLFGLGFKDTQCGAKVVRQRLIPKIIDNLTISNMAFDVNFLVDVKRAGGKTLEMPIEWEDSDGSTISNNGFKTSFVMALSVFRLWLLYSPFKFLYPTLIRPISEFLFHNLVSKEKPKMIKK